MSGPLTGLRVLDMTRILAGPWAGQTFADLGAEVIKIERPDAGDDTRSWGPPFLPGDDGEETGDAAYYLSANRGKSSVCVNMATEEGQALIRTLAKDCDILIENYKVGGLAKYGLDYESLRDEYPSLIYCSITGFGQTGPYKNRAGYDFMIQAMGGIMSVTGQPDGTPGAEPMKCGVAFSDLFTSLYAVIGVLAALHSRTQTGRGQHVDMALLDSQVAVLANQALNYLVSGVAPTRLGNAHPNIVPYQAFPTKDGFMILAIGSNRQFAAFCATAGLDGVDTDARFATHRARVENREMLAAIIADALETRTTEDWVTLLEPHAVPCGPIATIDEVFANPQVLARGLAIEQQRPDGQRIPGVANPIRLSETPIEYNKAAPALGQDTREVMRTLAGLDDAEIDRLIDAGVLGAK